jgi:hypothetical protein
MYHFKIFKYTRMKKLLTLVLFLTASYVFAQETQQIAPRQTVPQRARTIRLHVYTSYAFDDKVDSYYSSTEYFEGTIEGGFEYGGGLEYMLHEAYGLEFSYLRLDSKAPMEYYMDGIQHAEFDVASNYLMLGGNRYLVMNPKLEPYFGVQLGMCIFNIDNPETGNSGSATKFTWGIKAGLNIWASEKIAIKLQGGLLSAVQAVGGGLYFGTGGAGAGVASYSTFYQWTLGGGVVFSLGGR